MTNEEKDILLVDLCARLPYDVKVWVKTHDNEIIESDFLTLCNGIGYYSTLSYDGNIESSVVMPYLRPMSSMTMEEEKEYCNIVCEKEISQQLEYALNKQNGNVCNVPVFFNSIDWLNAHHFDYRGLIEKGLAVEAPEGMYRKTK